MSMTDKRAMVPQDFIPSKSSKTLPADIVSWKAPSNIALVKYWGKHGLQLPQNPSLSFTLSQCTTTTSLEFSPKTETSSKIDFRVLFKGAPAQNFRPKINKFFERIMAYAPFLRNYKFTIHTANSFPHSSGIASSASGMAALALCLVDMEAKINPGLSEAYLNKKASFLARLGSGSAARSINGPVTVWGGHPSVSGSTDYFAVPYPDEPHPHFKNYQDSILLVHRGRKQVSSSIGHDLMNNHPFAKSRFGQAAQNLTEFTEVLKTGDLERFNTLVESEALTLHAMMMTSLPYFILFKSNTIAILHKIWDFREHTAIPLCFTLDAGANVHVLYPQKVKKKVLKFIRAELSPFCEDGKFIEDEMGAGARRQP